MIGIVDCNSFYCEAETLFKPWLKGKAVAVASNNDGCLVSRNDQAKALGLKMGQPVFEIRDMVERGELHLFSSNYVLYQSLSNRVMAIIKELAPKAWIYSIDESFVDLSGIQDPEAWARDAKAQIYRRVGLPVGIGIARTMTLAKLANWAAKKWKHKTGCVVFLDSIEKEQKLLRYAGVGEVWGVGHRIEARLEQELNVVKAYDLIQVEPKLLRKHFNVNVERTSRELIGQRCFELGTDGPAPKQMIASTKSFGTRVYEIGDLYTAIASFVTTASFKLRQQHSLANCMQVFIRTSPFDQSGVPYTRSQIVQLPFPTCDARDLMQHARAAILSMYIQGPAYAKAGVVLSGLVEQGTFTEDLFAPKPRPKSEAVMKIMDSINAKQGRGTVRLATNKGEGAWSMSRKHLSDAFTTSWQSLPKGKC